MPRKSYHHGDLRRAILDTARNLVRHHGAARVSVRAIAREAGVSPAAPYHHFDDREAILATVAASGFEDLADAMLESAREGADEDPFHRLRGAGVAYVRFAFQNPEIYRLMFSGLLNDARFPDLERAAEGAFGVLRRLLGAARPESAGEDSRPVAITAWSTMHGLGMLVIDGLLEEASASAEVEEVARQVTTVLGRGLRSYAEPETR